MATYVATRPWPLGSWTLTLVAERSAVPSFCLSEKAFFFCFFFTRAWNDGTDRRLAFVGAFDVPPAVPLLSRD